MAIKKAFIKISYRQIIDNTCISEFERAVFNQSFDEFSIKCQEYNPKSEYFTLAQMIANNPKANSLHYKTAFSIFNTVKQLNNTIYQLYNTLGQANIPFEKYDFEIIESNPFNKAKHVVAITYTTPQFILLETIGNMLLLTPRHSANEANILFSTFMLQIKPSISIVEYETVDI